MIKNILLETKFSKNLKELLNSMLILPEAFRNLEKLQESTLKTLAAKALHLSYNVIDSVRFIGLQVENTNCLASFSVLTGEMCWNFEVLCNPTDGVLCLNNY